MIQIRKYNKQHPLRIFEAFAGYGSQSLAFKYLKEKHPEFDFKVVGYSEIESSAIQAYGLLHGRDITNYGDVTRIDWNKVPDFDFISWSSPCQDFSNAGLRKGAEEGSGTRSSLIFQERRMLEAKHPKYVMLENVKGLLSKSMRKYFFQYIRDLDSYGYTSFYKVLNAKDYGIPQNRERIFVISILRTEDDPNPEYHFPSPIKMETTVESEFADIAIRILSLLGWIMDGDKIELSEDEDLIGEYKLASYIFGFDLAGDLYRIIEKMGVLDLDSSPSWYLAKYLQELLMDIFAIAHNNRIDLKEQIKQKMKYNETRPYLHGYKY